MYKELVDGGLLVPMVAVIHGQKDADTPGIKYDQTSFYNYSKVT